MDKQKVTEFFDQLAPVWDENCSHSDETIVRILDNAGVKADDDVLDVACGTGVMIPSYLARGVRSVVGIDISEKMLEEAQRKFHSPYVRFLHADAETYPFEPGYDVCVVYNAFPHFPNPEALVQNLASALRPGGTLTIAHGSSRETINKGHMGAARAVSIHLPSDAEFRRLLEPFFNVTTFVSNDAMLQIVGVKR